MSSDNAKSHTLQQIANSQEVTQAIGKKLGEILRPGDLVLLRGDLGVGKTTLVQGVASGAGYTGPVTSPTFALIHQYPSKQLVLHHADLYRLEQPGEAESLGLEDILIEESGALIVEWPARYSSLLDFDHLKIEMSRNPDDARIVRFTPNGEDWADRVAAVEWNDR